MGKVSARRLRITPDALAVALVAMIQLMPFAARAVTPSIAAGWDRSCAVTRAGAALCWGDNDSGALGNGVTFLNPVPAPVSGLSSGVSQVFSSPSAFHACATTTAGQAFCWGNNTEGQLGNRTLAPATTPTPVSGLSSGVVAMAMGSLHSCSLNASGSVACWGSNFYGQIGDGSTSDSSAPVSVVALPPGVRAIAAGLDHTCALTSGNTVLCWGHNDSGQLGDGTTINRSQPVAVRSLPAGITAIAAGFRHTCALTGTGAAYCWGDNGFGQLGNGTTVDSSAAVAVSNLSTGVAQIAPGGYHTCARTTGGGVMCWGYNGDGQLGNGTTANTSTPVSVSGLTGIGTIASGYGSTCAVTTSGSVRCWGWNGFGQLANGTQQSSATPVAASGFPAPVASITLGEYHGCATTATGAAVCWGGNTQYQLGTGGVVGVPTPTTVSGLSSGVAQVDSGQGHTCALTQAGVVKCWGENGQGQLGIGVLRGASSIPQDVGTGATAIATGHFFSCALSGGFVYCWGDNQRGQLGDGTTLNRALPVQVAGLTGITQIGAGAVHACGLTSGGDVLCLGYNAYGQLGDATTIDRHVAVRVGLPSRATAIALGAQHTCAITSSGGAYCWGGNAYGKLGNGTTNDTSVPSPVVGLSSGVAAMTGGWYHTCALTAAGGVSCWGSNRFGQLGNATTADSSVPVQVAGLSSGVVAIAAGAYHTCALMSSGYVVCWGGNDTGGLGDGTFAQRTRPAVTSHESGTGSLAGNDWFLDLDPGSAKAIPADRIPTFVARVSGNSATSIVSVTANLQFRTQDLGRRIYVYGYVPASRVVGAALEKDTAACVLAQLSGSGQPQQASASSLQGYASNVTSTQGQAVEVLNGVLASNVAGATFCVGTAASSAQAVDAANSRCVATVPATGDADPICLAPDGATATSYQGLWLKLDESGWGVNVTHQGTTMFATWFTYDTDGSGMWLVASNVTQASAGNFSGTLYRTAGPAFSANPFNSISFPANYTTVGSLSFSFTDANNGTMSYTVNGVSQTKAIVRYIYAAGGTNCVLGGAQGASPNYQDLWLRSATGTQEAGWGINITHQGDILFATWFTYQAGSGSANKGMWLVMSNGNKVANGVYSGTLYRTRGPPFSSVPFTPITFPANYTNVGSGTFTFTDANNGTFAYTVDGISQTKPIARYVYATPSTVCQ